MNIHFITEINEIYQFSVTNVKFENNPIEITEEKAKEILTEATNNARQLAVETNDLKKKTRVFHSNMLLMLQSQLEMVKTPEWEEILAPFSSYVQESHQVIREVLSKELDSENVSEVNSSEAFETADSFSVVEASEKVVHVSDSEVE